MPPGPPILSPLLEPFARLLAEERERERQEAERRRRFDEHQATQMAALFEAGVETQARRASEQASRQASGANEQGPPGVDPEVVARQQRILDKIQRRVQRVPGMHIILLLEGWRVFESFCLENVFAPFYMTLCTCMCI